MQSFHSLPLFIALLLAANPGVALALLQPTNVTITIPTGSNNTGAGNSAATAFTDDILLSSLTFSGSTFLTNSGNVQPIQATFIASGNANVNAEFGDNDTNSDGNDNPFVKAGITAPGAPIPLAIQESVDPNIQNTTITEAFSDLSINEGVDGEGPQYVMDLYFTKSIIDNRAGTDVVPEIIAFERGLNSSFDLQVIYGGTYGSPLLSQIVSVAATDMFATGIFINTSEITSGQQLGVVGIDLSDFGLSASTAALGVRITSTGNSGADLYGVFVNAENASQLTPFTIPEPSSVALAVSALGLLAFAKKRK